MSAVSPIRWTFLSAIISASAMAVQLVVVSRFLTVSELGTAAIAMMILGFATVIADFGVNKVLIKEQGDLAPGLRTLLYAIELGLGFAIWIIVWMSSPALAHYYAAPELASLLRHGSVALLIIPIGHQFYFLISRDLLFRKLAIIEIVSSIAGVAIVIFAAILNEGAYAIVWGWAGNLSLRYLLIAFDGWQQYPLARRWTIKGSLPHLKFGFYATVENIVSFISTNIDYLVIGYFLGPQQLGYYALAYQVATFAPQKIAPILTRVAFPMFAKQQADGSVLRAGYLNFSQLAIVLTLPLLAGVLITAPLLVQVVFGVAWEQSIPILQLLTIVGVGKMVIVPVVPLLLAKGRADLAFASGLLFTLVTFIVFLLIVEMGLQAVAASFAVVSCCYAAYMLGLVRWIINLKLLTYLSSLKTASVATFWMSLAAYLIVAQTIISVQATGRLLAAIFIGGIIYGAYIVVADRRMALNIQNLLTGRSD
ncbi:MOP flippase family protein [Bradyrhizobium sp. AUGA SZCCT0283]|uniref:MOP flippase family protein n=1 Tax=Bradyrhizobium sp. AUGA SZCCT0283 TaxID=2807671 RepID=UPI001BAD9C55|nr:MOP flippase family protein [Bradyrhizobium sp. AUGA SZCCT0283]MBR1280269.1 MOP flippase family protein [Bradyrhizobium sp. AUGA SZCCT0283]